MTDMPHIRDQILALCNLVCEEQYDGVMRQSSVLFSALYGARSAVLLLLDAMAQKLVVTSGIRAGDTHWAPPPLQVDLAKDQAANGVFSQVALTGQPARLSKTHPVEGMGLIGEIMGMNAPVIQVLPLNKPNGNFLGCVLLAGEADAPPAPAEDSTRKVITKAISALITQKLAAHRSQSLEQGLRSSLGRADQDRADLRERVLRNLERRLPGGSSHMRGLRKALLREVSFENTLTILGPDGCGKERVAIELHKASRKSRSPFVYVNCREFTDDNFAPLMFGFKRGAIQGVAAARKGYIPEAGEGIVYLDRLDLLSPRQQEILARLLESRTYRVHGSERDVPLAARIISAAPLDLPDRVAEGAFLGSLFYRMSKTILRIAPLTERREDIPDIVERHLSDLTQRHKKRLELDVGIMPWLMQHPLNGNQRELESLVERAYERAMEQGGALCLEHFKDELEPVRPAASTPCRSLPSLVSEYERGILRTTLIRHGYDRVKAANELQIPKRTLADKCKKYQLS